jgi:hypothetical protein
MAGWRDYLGLLPFVRSRTPPAPVKPSANLLSYSVSEVPSLTWGLEDIAHLSVSVTVSDGATTKSSSPLRRITQ